MTLKEKKLERACPVCGANQGSILHHQKFTLPKEHFLPLAYDVVYCVNCGFVFADTPASQDVYDRYYQDLSKYESLVTASGSGLAGYDQQRLRDTAKDIAGLLSQKNSSILDVGCANGGLLAALADLGYKNLTGLDPSVVCVNRVKELGFNGVLGGLYTKNNFFQKFDCILLTHVLEHVYEVKQAIINMLSWLKEGGILYLEVPDASRYKDFFITPFYFFDVEHINHFDAASLKNLLGNFHGQVVKVGQKNMPVSNTNFYPAIYVVFKQESGKGQLKAVEFDDAAILSVRAHIEQSKSTSSNPKLEALAESQEPVIVWGAGQAAQRLLQSTRLSQTNIQFFIDNDQKKHGFIICGRPVFGADHLHDFKGTIVICSALHSREILKQIKDLGFTGKTLVVT